MWTVLEERDGESHARDAAANNGDVGAIFQMLKNGHLDRLGEILKGQMKSPQPE